MFPQQSVSENLSAMNRSTFLLFLCVFALSEVSLTAVKMRISGAGGGKHSNVMRRVRSVSVSELSENVPSCPNDSQCNDVCVHFGSGGGGMRQDFWNGMCKCDVGKDFKTDEMCVEACKILGLGGGFVPSDDELDCECNPCRKSQD
ncbi:hypothetical protein DdX_17057 [Ditylenchus destructor]|uniref:Uncharacterized protein n=1 Tax=Ditylenchus destructor TaxID=166010 RepID=A0AAD4QW47_9BILA|nr:hypothetical protein DdX_17057 [Ditylenchus destructor]